MRIARAKNSMRFHSLLFAALVLAHAPLHAQPTPKRLSDWLLEQPTNPDAYPLGLSWRVPGEVAAQLTIRRDLLIAISSNTDADPQAAARLRGFDGGAVRAPLREISADEARQLAEALEPLG